MKTAALIICSSLIVFSASAQNDSSRNAFKPQTDTSRNAFRSNPSPTLQNPALQTPSTVQPQTQYRIEDRIQIRHDELPNSLRETLMGNQYKGWENSTFYQDRTSGEYYYTPSPNPNTNTNTNLNTQSQSPYMRFDRNGRAIPNTTTGGKDQ